MERIKQALERAREERQGAEPTVLNSQRPGGAAPSPEACIAYTQTRVARPDPAALARHRILGGEDQPEVVTAYKMLRTQVLQRMVANGWKALAVTSPGAGAGKSVTALNLALSLAREVAYTVLLVDFDLRRPALHEYLGIAPGRGIGDYLLRDVPLSDVLVNPGIERLVLLPGREPIYNSAEMLRSPKTVRLVEELKSRYPTRLVVFDLPPLLCADDALAFSPYADAVLLVLEEGATTRREIQATRELLGVTPILGTVLNKSRERVRAYQ